MVQKELKPIYNYLKDKGYQVFGFAAHGPHIINCLFWYHNGKVFNIQTNTRYRPIYADDLFDFGISFIPSREYGSGVTLYAGVSAADIFNNIEKYYQTPPKNYNYPLGAIKHYKNMEAYLKRVGSFMSEILE